MSEYKGIKGFQVQTRTEDPTPYAQALANNPYARTWSSGGSLNTARSNINGAGVQTAAIAFGGNIASGGPQPYSVQDLTENYNGTSWTEVNDLNQARNDTKGSGTATAGLAVGGYLYPPSASPSPSVGIQLSVEKWDGTNWTEVAEFSDTRYGHGISVSSPNSDTMIAGGYTGSPPSATTSAAEVYNGTSWTENTAMSNSKGRGLGLGAASTAVLMIDSETESWNGSSWTEVAEMNSPRSSAGAAGPYTAGIIFGGSPNNSSVLTELWDGSAWTELNDLGTARGELGGAGGTSAATSALAFGGNNSSGTRQSVTEEWAFSGLPPSTPAAAYADAITGDFYYNSTTGQFKTVNTGGAPIGTWASGANMNTARQALGGAGATYNAVLGFGGILAPATAMSANTESYDGTAWSELADLNTARGYKIGGAGIQTAALAFGGGSAPGADHDETEHWNGSSWTELNDLNSAREGGGSAGFVYTAALLAGGYDNATRGYTETWDGTNWTEVSDLNTARQGLNAFGTSTAAIAVGGSPGVKTETESWDGSSWTEIAEINEGRAYAGAFGTSTDGIVFAGYDSPGSRTTNTEAWNGTSWTEVNNLGTARESPGEAGQSGSSGLAFGGYVSDESTITEEWVAKDFQIKSVTTS